MASARKAPLVRWEKVADFVETAYALAPDDQAWLEGVMHAALGMCRWAAASHGAVYDARDAGAFRARNLALVGFPAELRAQIVTGLDLHTPSFVANLLRALPQREIQPLFSGWGFVDALGVNGLDPSGMGAFFVLWANQRIEISQAERDLFRRLAHHLGAAHRVRRRLRESQPDSPTPDPTVGAEAIFDAGNRIVHATGPARSQAAREDLVASAIARDRLRTSSADPGEGLRAWRPLTRARWSLVDSFDRAGARAVVARENRSLREGLEILTDRERQAVAYLAMGQSTKETAYALGISDITVRVLLARAAASLGVRSRDELLAHDQVRLFDAGGKAPAAAVETARRSPS